MMRVMKKKSPPPFRRKEKTRERAGGETHQALSEEEIKQRPRKPTKSADAPSIRHDIKYTPQHSSNQPMKGNSHNQHTHRTPTVASLNRSKGSHTTQRPHPSASSASTRQIRQVKNPTPKLPAPRHGPTGRKAGRGDTCRPCIFRIFHISVSLYLCIFSIHISILDSLYVLSAPCRISSCRIASISCIVYIEIHRFFSRSESS